MKTRGKTTIGILMFLIILSLIACNTTPTTPTTPATPTPSPESTPAPTPSPESTPAPTPSPESTQTATPPAETTGDPCDDPDWPVRWISIDPPLGIMGVELTVVLNVPPGSLCELNYATQVLYRSGKFPTVVADKDGYAELRLMLHYRTSPVIGSNWPGYLELTNTKTDGSSIVVKHPYNTQ